MKVHQMVRGIWRYMLMGWLFVSLVCTAIAGEPNTINLDTEDPDSEFNIDDIMDVSSLSEEANLFVNAYITTGTKDKRLAIDSPFLVFTLDRQQIDALCPTDIADILKAIPGFDTFSINNDTLYASEPGLNTEAGSQYLLLVDGVSFGNKRARGADWSTIPVQMNEIERVEYLPGAQSPLYGSNASIGVLNIITKRVTPETWNKDNPSTVSLRVGSDGLQLYDLTHHKQDKKLTSTVWGSFRTIDNLDDAVNYPAASTAYKDYGESDYKRGGFSLKNDIDKTSNLRLDFTYLQGEREPYLPTMPDGSRESLQEMSTALTYSDSGENSHMFTFTMRHRNNKSESSSALVGGDFSDTQFEARKQFAHDGNKIITLGGYYMETAVNGSAYGNEEAKVYESSGNALVEWSLKDEQSIFAGINAFHSSFTGTDPSYKIFYKKKTQKDEVFRVGYSTSVRGPDIFFTETADLIVPRPPAMGGPLKLRGGNDALENEEFSCAEISYEKRTPSSSLQSRFYIGDIDNRIFTIRTGESFTPPMPPGAPTMHAMEFVNEEETIEQLGLTTTWDRNFSKKWRSTLSWRYLNATNESGVTSFYSPKHAINFSATYLPSDKLSLNLFSKTNTHYSTEDGTLQGTNDVGGYTKLDLAIRYKLNHKKSQECWLKINNITDREIIEGYGIQPSMPGPGWEIGRQFTAGYSFKF